MPPPLLLSRHGRVYGYARGSKICMGSSPGCPDPIARVSSGEGGKWIRTMLEEVAASIMVFYVRNIATQDGFKWRARML